ncbi:MAG: hypothetical protein CMM91_06155 [Rickettsiales bacterium]|jgi:hypothetical protein|nr:hypothetical protein [Rickettsiales bacterium]
MSSSRNNALEFSSVGSIVINPADGTTTGTFGAIQFLKDSEIDVIDGTNIPSSDLSNLETDFGSGTILYGNFTSVSLSSGLAQLHRV